MSDQPKSSGDNSGRLEGTAAFGRQVSSGRDSIGLRGRYVPGTAVEKPSNNDTAGIVGILLHPLNLLLACLPIGVWAFFHEWSDVWIFWLNFSAMIPLAKILGDATEELQASLKNDMLAGLLNATFGNAVELVLMIQTLRAGLYSVVKATLLGSVLSNTLLVLGASFFFGGIFSTNVKEKKNDEPAPPTGSKDYAALAEAKDTPVIALSTEINDGEQVGRGSLGATNVMEKVQTFSVLGALVNTSMLLISCMSFSLITVFRSVTDDTSDEYRDTILLPVSRISSIVIMAAYVAYILFQLVTHRSAMTEDGGDDEDSSTISMQASIGMLFVTTVVVACCSDMVVHAIKGISESGHMSQHFIGMILLPIVGNACEHAAAVRFAMQDKLGLSVSIAIGSSTQIALFVVPFSVLMGWAIDRPMDLNFGTLNTAMITLSVIVVLSMVVDGQSNWLQGYLLMSVYVIIAVMYAYLPDDHNSALG